MKCYDTKVRLSPLPSQYSFALQCIINTPMTFNCSTNLILVSQVKLLLPSLNFLCVPMKYTPGMTRNKLKLTSSHNMHRLVDSKITMGRECSVPSPEIKNIGITFDSKNDNLTSHSCIMAYLKFAFMK